MAVKTIAQLLTEAQTIKNETLKNANTALRVGGFLEDTIDSLESFIDGKWEFYLDSQATEASKQLITAGSRTKITNDGLFGTIISNTGDTQTWNTSTNKIQPEFENSFINIRFALHAESVGGGTNYFDIEFDISGGTYPIIWEETGVLIKGAGVHQSFNFDMKLFVGSDFFVNGGEIYITPLADINIWEIGLTINRTYKDITP